MLRTSEMFRGSKTMFTVMLPLGQHQLVKHEGLWMAFRLQIRFYLREEEDGERASFKVLNHRRSWEAQDVGMYYAVKSKGSLWDKIHNPWEVHLQSQKRGNIGWGKITLDSMKDKTMRSSQYFRCMIWAMSELIGIPKSIFHKKLRQLKAWCLIQWIKPC